MRKKGIGRLGEAITYIVIMIALVGLFIFLNFKLSRHRKETIKILPDSNKFCYQIENSYSKDNILYLSGWFFRIYNIKNVEQPIEENEENRIGIILFPVDGEEDEEGYSKGIDFEMEYSKRTDVNQYFRCDYDYSHSGFNASLDMSKIDINKTYHILIKPDLFQKDAVQTNYFIVNGKLTSLDPEDSNTLDIKGTDLEEIVEHGICLVSRPDVHMYVYQYNKKLYWIAEEGFYFEEDGTTFVQYQLDTTQFDKLPQDRIDAGAYWSNISGLFEEYEKTDNSNYGKYRVYVRDIPTDYSITMIYTGYFTDGKWIWQQAFRPVYRELFQ